MDVVLYHVTAVANRESIARHGIETLAGFLCYGAPLPVERIRLRPA
jgi:hypothetical protein